MEEAIDRKNMNTARNDAIISLNKYILSKEEKYLNEAFNFDNTNPKILYYYLTIKKGNQKVYETNYNRYKFLLNKDFSAKLNEEYIDHKKDVISILNSIKDIKIDPLNIDSLKNSLTTCYSREDMENYEPNSTLKINNMPFNIEDEHMFFLSVKVCLGAKLYNIIDANIDEINKNEMNKDVFINCICYL